MFFLLPRESTEFMITHQYKLVEVHLAGSFSLVQWNPYSVSGFCEVLGMFKQGLSAVLIISLCILTEHNLVYIFCIILITLKHDS